MEEKPTPEKFRESLHSHKYTQHQLRMMLQTLRRAERAEALLGIFANPSRDQSVYWTDQTLAGNLLMSLRPKCHQSIEQVLQTIAANWNPSVEQLPIFLASDFGVENVVVAARRLADKYVLGSREWRSLAIIRWMLGDKSVKWPD